ncbi:septum formation initiator family protein [Streptomyces phaeochromogenes]|nr:septum formation initiator family protein [Streptomyces phaeochromogenes]
MPEIADWAEHLREQIDSTFSTDGDAAAALGVEAPDLSKFLSGRKAPERSFVRTVHTACARRHGRSVDDRALQRTDTLYMRALEQFNPQVWRLLSALDERDAAVEKECAVRQDLSLLRGWLNRSDDEVAQLRRDLAAAREERAELAAKVNGLLADVRRLEEEAVVAEAIRIAERAAANPQPLAEMDIRTVRRSGAVLALCTLACVVGLGVALIGGPLADGGSPWQTRGWAVASGAAVVGAVAGWLRQEVLKRLGTARNSDALWAALLVVVGFAAQFYLVNMGIRNQQDYLEHRSTVSAAVTNCRENLTSPSSSNPGRPQVPTYTCTYTWKAAGRTYQQRDAGLDSDEGKRTNVLIDPAVPFEMLPERFGLRDYVWLYLLAVFALALPAGGLYLFRNAWQETLFQMRRAQQLKARHAAAQKPSPARRSVRQ